MGETMYETADQAPWNRNGTEDAIALWEAYHAPMGDAEIQHLAECAAEERETAARYTTWGSVRDGCGHRHRSADLAEKCIERDQRACASQGGYSDRRVYAVGSDGYLLKDSGRPLMHNGLGVTI